MKKKGWNKLPEAHAKNGSEPIAQSSVVNYASFVLTIVLAILPLYWWLKALLALILLMLIAIIIWRSPYTVRWPRIGKVGAFVLVAGVLFGSSERGYLPFLPLGFDRRFPIRAVIQELPTTTNGAKAPIKGATVELKNLGTTAEHTSYLRMSAPGVTDVHIGNPERMRLNRKLTSDHSFWNYIPRWEANLEFVVPELLPGEVIRAFIDCSVECGQVKATLWSAEHSDSKNVQIFRLDFW